MPLFIRLSFKASRRLIKVQQWALKSSVFDYLRNQWRTLLVFVIETALVFVLVRSQLANFAWLLLIGENVGKLKSINCVGLKSCQSWLIGPCLNCIFIIIRFQTLWFIRNCERLLTINQLACERISFHSNLFPHLRVGHLTQNTL